MSEGCGQHCCSICTSVGGSHSSGMHWWPELSLTCFNAYEQDRGLRWWFTNKEVLAEALDWVHP